MGALLVVTGIRLWFAGEPDAPKVGFLHRLCASGRWSPALLAVAFADVIFAVDSIPAVLAITTDTFLVFAANAFALLGLRALYFLVRGRRSCASPAAGPRRPADRHRRQARLMAS